MFAIDHLLADDLSIKVLFYGMAGSPTCMIFQGKRTHFSDGLYTLQFTRAMKHVYTTMPQITEKDGKNLFGMKKKQNNKSAYEIRQISYLFHGYRQIRTYTHLADPPS